MKYLIRIMKDAGSWRILVGSFIVISLLLLASLGRFLTPYAPEEMDPDWIMEPPSSAIFRSFLVTEKGLNNLMRTPSHSNRSSGKKNYEEEDDELGDLQDIFTTDEQTEKEEEIKRATNKHYFGTDKDGRDILALIVAGAKICLFPGLVACLVALGLGIPLGLLGGYYGGRWADAIQFLNAIILSFPRFILILIVICALEPDVYLTMVILGLTIVPRVSELIRTRVRMLSRMGFVLAAQESGLSDFKIMWRHLFWFQNRTVFFIQASMIMAESILVETTLSYLQFGTKPPDVSWGNIIEGSRLAFFSEYYWITFFPAVAIVVSILGFYYLGDGLNARMEARDRR